MPSSRSNNAREEGICSIRRLITSSPWNGIAIHPVAFFGSSLIMLIHYPLKEDDDLPLV